MQENTIEKLNLKSEEENCILLPSIPNSKYMFANFSQGVFGTSPSNT